MAFLCECNGPCRRVIDISADTYHQLRSIGGTVLTPECAEREGRAVIHRHYHVAVVAHSTFPPHRAHRPPRSL